MHMGVVFLNGPTQHSVGEWRLQRNMSGYDYTSMPFWQDVGRILERGKFDVVFLADILGIYDAYEGSIDATVKYSLQFPVHDAIPLVPVIAAATEKIGVAATFSATYAHPYVTARTFLTLAHLTNGRAGWNVVASSHGQEAATMGLDAIPGHDERYERADEFVEVVHKLWNSWEKDAVVMDRETGVYADPAKLHAVNHIGKYFKSRGPINITPPPKGLPVMFAAGQSPRGLGFCGKYAEAVFAIQWSGKSMREHREKIREHAKAHGRDPDSVKVLWGIMPIVGETEQAARDKEAKLRELVPPVGGLAMVANHIGRDLSGIPLDAKLDAMLGDSGSQGIAVALERMRDGGLTVAEAVQMYASGISPHVTGTAKQVADQLEAYHHESGGDGFLLMTHILPGSLSEFTEDVVPELQRRGLMRKDYTGTTLREHLNQEEG